MTGKRNIGLWKNSSGEPSVDDEVVLSGADFGRCHTGRQFRREGLCDLHVSGPEFSRGDRLERGEVFFIVPPFSVSVPFDFSALPRLRNRGFLRFVRPIDTSSRKNNWDARRGTFDDLYDPIWRIFVSFVDDLRTFHPRVNWFSVLVERSWKSWMKNLPVGRARSRLSFSFPSDEREPAFRGHFNRVIKFVSRKPKRAGFFCDYLKTITTAGTGAMAVFVRKEARKRVSSLTEENKAMVPHRVVLDIPGHARAPDGANRISRNFYSKNPRIRKIMCEPLVPEILGSVQSKRH